MRPYTEELIYTQSEDGLALEGALIRPAEVVTWPIALVWIHGNTGKFYDWPYVVLGRALAQAGYLFVTANTRGHDISTTLWHEPDFTERAGGSAWEELEESPHDLAAWITYAMTLDVQGVALIGHSQGATKVIYYQAQRHDPRVRGVALASPDLHGHWSAELVAAAERLVEVGQGQELLPPLMGAPWYRLSAQNVVSRNRVFSLVYHAPEQPASLAAIACPVLAFFSATRDVGGEAELEVIRRTAGRAMRVETQVIAGGDHVYTGVENDVATLLAQWVQTLPLFP